MEEHKKCGAPSTPGVSFQAAGRCRGLTVIGGPGRGPPGKQAAEYALKEAELATILFSGEAAWRELCYSTMQSF
jgi:hypothetical protein